MARYKVVLTGYVDLPDGQERIDAYEVSDPKACVEIDMETDVVMWFADQFQDMTVTVGRDGNPYEDLW